MHLAEAVTGPDGALIAGAGTTLAPPVLRALRRLGIESVQVREADDVADWEEDKDLVHALADLEGRFAAEGPDPHLEVLRDALRRHLVARGTREAS